MLDAVLNFQQESLGSWFPGPGANNVSDVLHNIVLAQGPGNQQPTYQALGIGSSDSGVHLFSPLSVWGC